MQKDTNQADYSVASPEERENVIAILNRNVKEIIKRGQVKNANRVEAIVATLAERIQRGDLIKGKDFERLILLFRKKSPE